MAKFLEFVLENQDYGILVDNVCKVSQLHDIVRIPQTPRFVLGVTSYGKQIITVIDLKCLLGILKAHFARCQLAINIYINHSFYELSTDDIIGVIDVNPQNVRQISVLGFKLIMLNK